MTGPAKVSGSRDRWTRAGSALRPRKYPVSDATPLEVIEDGPSIAGRLAWLDARLTSVPRWQLAATWHRYPGRGARSTSRRGR